MLAVAAIAGFWAKASSGLRSASIILASVAVFAGVSFGVAYATVNGAEAPASIVVDGQPMSLTSGRQFIFFYDPECTHCAAAAASMAPLSFKDDVTLIAVPVRVQQWAQDFLNDAKLTQAKTSLDVEKLREKFVFEYPPYAVLIEDGKVAGTIPHFEDGGDEHILQMRELGVIN